MRRMVGDFELNLGVAMVAAIACAIEGTFDREQWRWMRMKEEVAISSVQY